MKGDDKVHRREKQRQRAILLFFALTVIFMVTTIALAVNLPKRISAMNEVKAAVVELEEGKDTQTKELEQVTSKMDDISTQIEALQNILDKLIEAGEKVTKEPIDENAKHAYLTFDDGPSDNTIRILDELKKNDVKATFFVIGKDGYDEVYKRIVDEGHTLAIHSNTHDYASIYTSVYSFMTDINTLADKLENITGYRPTVMRFPGGSNNTVSYKYGGEDLMDKLVNKVTEVGFVYFDWNVDSTDATGNNIDKDVISHSVLNGSDDKHNAIILMHDAAAKKTTADALPQIIAGLQKKGFVFAPIDDQTPTVQFKKPN